MKILKNIVLLISMSLLFSCASQNSSSDIDAKTKNLLKNNAVDAAENVTDVKEEIEEIKEMDDETRERLLRESMKKAMELNKPAYQRMGKNTKRIERKKIVVKPITDVGIEPYSFSKSDIDSFFDGIDEIDVFEANKKYSTQSINLLIDNYKNIMKTSNICCPSNVMDGLATSELKNTDIESLKSKNARNLSVFDRCLILSDADILNNIKNKRVSNIISNARNKCICNNKETLRKNINNFYRLYNADNEFYKEELIYRYKDSNGKIIEEDMNQSVLNVAFILEECQ